MLVPILLFLVGLAALIKGGDWFVEGATGIARRFRIPELLIGATVVSIGTTLPEVMVSASSAVQGHSEIAYGNAIGSIICNAALIAAVTVAVRPGKVAPKSLRLPVIFFFIAAVFYAAIAYTTGYFSRLAGLLLLLIFVVYLILSVLQVRRSPQPAETGETVSKSQTARDIAILVLGAALVAVGADLLVDNGTLIAQFLGVPESVIALTVMALGTSLPELVTAITSLVKGHSSLSLGNIIGANLFNLVLVNGISVILNPYHIPCNEQIAGINSSLVLDIPVMLLCMAILALPVLPRGKMYRTQGIVLLIVYAAFCAVRFAL